MCDSTFGGECYYMDKGELRHKYSTSHVWSGPLTVASRDLFLARLPLQIAPSADGTIELQSSPFNGGFFLPCDRLCSGEGLHHARVHAEAGEPLPDSVAETLFLPLSKPA